jgi:lambda family phage portal protein
MYHTAKDTARDGPRGMYAGIGGSVARVFDAVLGPIAPRLVLKRQRARIESAALLSYDAAKKKRTRREHQAGSADTDLLLDLPQIRTNSRSMVRDDGHASAMVRVLEDNIIGTGLRPQVMLTAETAPGMTDKQAQDWGKSCEQVFADWAEDQADASEHGSFWALQQLVLRSLVVDGEALLHRTFVDPDVLSWRSLGTAFEMIDVDRLHNPFGSFTEDIRSGVELGLRAQAIAYWITPRHPDENRVRWPTPRMQRNYPERWTRFAGGLPSVLHIFRRERTGQHRGVPFFASCFDALELLNHYIETESIAAVAASKFCGFIKQTMDANALSGLDPTITQDANGRWHEKLESGTLRYLNDGEEFQAYAPNRPGGNFDPFVVRVLRSICAALGLPYELVLKDFGGMNFSSARVALLESRRGFEVLQQLIVEQLCQPAFRSVVMDAVVSGVLPTPRGFLDNPRPFFRAAWQPPAWGWVDPVKEVEAAVMAIEGNLSTPQAEASRQGQDYESILMARARAKKREIEIEKQFGLPPGSLTAVPLRPAPAAPADNSEPGATGKSPAVPAKKGAA